MNEKLKTGPQGLALIKHFESLHDGDLTVAGLQPKLCPVGIWTVGWGHAIIDPITKELLRGEQTKARAYDLFGKMTEEEAEKLLADDLRPRESIVRNLVKVPLEQGQFDALVSFVFNVGKLWSTTLLEFVNAGKFEAAADAFLAWNKGRVKGELQVLKGLTARRNAERVLFLTGAWKP